MVRRSNLRVAPLFGALMINILLHNSFAVTDPGLPDKGGSATENTDEANGDITIMLPGNIPLEMVKIRVNTFMMGRCSDEKDSLGNESPQHKVTIEHDFYLGKYETTQEQWQAIQGANPSYFIGGKLPVEQVSWDDVKDFLEGLNRYIKNTGKYQFDMRLPTEAEWEYSCRSGSKTRFFWGDDPTAKQINTYAWYESNSKDTTHPVGMKTSNKFGLYDMSGNVWEWCEDDWHPTYYDAPNDGRAWIEEPRNTVRVLRGGAWNDFDWVCRSSMRIGYIQTMRLFNLGFRIAATCEASSKKQGDR